MSRLISICRDIFQSYSAPEELSSDGDHPSHPSNSHSSYETGLLNTDYHQPPTHNLMVGRACCQVSQENKWQHRSSRVAGQYRNTPIQSIGLSPTQLLLHRRLRDFIPSQPTLYKPHTLDICSTKSQDNSISSERPSHRTIQQNNTHLMSPSKGANSDNRMTNNPPMGHNRSSHQNTPQPPIPHQS